jgi:glucose uptake protein
MILPTSYTTALLLTFLTMICWGSWANTTKLTGKWRFELFYYDYALGVLLAATILAFTFGSMGDGLTFQDNLLITGKRQIAYAFVAGGVFNLANILLVAAITVAGMAVAFPVGIGLALVIGVVWSYFLNPQGNPNLLFLGSLLVVGAIIVDAMAYRGHAAAKAKARTGQEKSKTKTKNTQKVGWKGIVLSVVCGLLMGSFYPLVEMSKAGDLGLGPYTVGFVFGVAVFLSTFVFNLFFMNIPVSGPPIRFLQYFRGSLRQHSLGIVGGVIWCVGAVANFAAASAPPEVQVGPAISYAIGQGATLVSALWGLLLWKEFAGASPRVKGMLAAMLLLFVVGLGLVSIAPLYAK